MTSVSPRGREAVAGARAAAPQLAEVVDLAVEHDADRAVLVGDRRIAGDEVDDREAVLGDECAVSLPPAMGVGTTVVEQRDLPLDDRDIARGVVGQEAGDAAHGDGMMAASMATPSSLEPAPAAGGSPLDGLRVGYAPLSPSLEQPGDRRRFVYYAQRRGIEFEIADPAKDYDVVVVSQRADIVRGRAHGRGACSCTT